MIAEKIQRINAKQETDIYYMLTIVESADDIEILRACQKNYLIIRQNNNDNTDKIAITVAINTTIKKIQIAVQDDYLAAKPQRFQL